MDVRKNSIERMMLPLISQCLNIFVYKKLDSLKSTTKEWTVNMIESNVNISILVFGILA